MFKKNTTFWRFTEQVNARIFIDVYFLRYKAKLLSGSVKTSTYKRGNWIIVRFYESIWFFEYILCFIV